MPEIKLKIGQVEEIKMMNTSGSEGCPVFTTKSKYIEWVNQ